MFHCVLKHWHPMAGVDFHIPWPPGSPSPAPSPVPYKTGMLLIGPTTLTCKLLETVVSDSWGITVGVGTDIGPLIPHIGPPSVTLPIEMLFSSSKSHFTTSLYQGKNQPIACALLVIVNPNLNCGNPLPTPTGFVIAMTTHVVGMTWGDVFGGLGAMFGDFCVQAVLNKLGNMAGGALGGFLQKSLFGRFFQNWAIKALLGGGHPDLALSWAGVMAASQAERVGNWAGTALGVAIGFFSGGPMGADIGTAGGYNGDRDNPWTPGGKLGETVSDQYRNWGQEAGQALDDYLNSPDPDVGDYPLPPAGGPQSA
jgi:hypothetical protein